MPTAEERRRNTEYARAARARELASLNASATTCRALLARRKPCRTPLQSRFVNGQTVPFCPTCDRKARGICIDCGTAPVDGIPRRSLRCALCQRLEKQAAYARYRQRNRTKLQAREARREADPVKHAAKLTYKKLYRASRPSKIAAYKKADYEKHREKYLAYHREYRAKKRAERAAIELARYHGTLAPRTCLTCDTVLTGRAKKCTACKQQARKDARAAIAERLARHAA